MSLLQSFWAEPKSSTSMQSSNLIPLPTVSTLLSRSSSPQRPNLGRSHDAYDPADPLIPLQRAEVALQRQIQDLLDAQSDCLFPQPQSPTTQASAKSPQRAVPRRQPARQAMPVSEVRRGISSAMLELASVKSRQSAILGKRISEIVAAIDEIDGWQDREESLRAEMDSLRTTGNDDEMAELRQQDHSLQHEINVLEVKLSDLKSQQRAVKVRLSQKTNTLESDLASFRESLALLESRRRAFLRRPSRDLFRSLPQSEYLALKPERRTVKLAEDALREAKGLETSSQGEINEEKAALDDGAAIWDGVVTQVTEIETAVRSELRELMNARQDASDTGADEGMSRLRQYLDSTITGLESKISDAEQQGRSLLVCCIGAELEALKCGREVLKQATHQASATLLGDDAAHEFATEGPSSPVHEYKGRRLKQGSGSTTDESDGDPASLLISNAD